MWRIFYHFLTVGVKNLEKAYINYYSAKCQYCGEIHECNNVREFKRHHCNKKRIIEKEGVAYAKNFQFSILEVRSAITNDEVIIKRETHWKNIMKTREFGYNKN